MNYSGNKKDVAQFVSVILRLFAGGLQSITITPLEKSGVCSVSIAIDTPWVGTVEKLAQTYSLTRQNISSEMNTQVG